VTALSIIRILLSHCVGTSVQCYLCTAKSLCTESPISVNYKALIQHVTGVKLFSCIYVVDSPLPPEYRDKDGVRYTLEPQTSPNNSISILGSYHCSWKPRSNHFNSHADFKAKGKYRNNIYVYSSKFENIGSGLYGKLWYGVLQMLILSCWYLIRLRCDASQSGSW